MPAIPKNLSELALDLCKEWIRAGVTRVPLNEKDLDRFTAQFLPDFVKLLDGPRGAAVWRRDGQFVRQLGRYIGTIAEFYAVASGTLEPVRMEHLRRALAVIRPECQLPVRGMLRGKYCLSVSTD